jgi:rfaE bifunctional protein kinase chain/domain
MSSPAFDLQALRAVVARFRGRTVAVLGDVMVDRYLWGRVDRISPEAPVPVVEVERETTSLGGAGNVAANVSALGGTPRLVAVTGEDDEARLLQRSLESHGVAASGLVADPGRPTTVKTRIVAHSQQVVRADREARGDVSGAPLERLRDALARELESAEALVISDYGKGVIHPATLETALDLAARRDLPVCVDPKESHIDSYRGATILTPNQHEAGYVQGRRIVDEASLAEVGWGLQKRLDAKAVLITRGPGGMSLFEQGGRYTYLPTVAREVYDVTGAGDTVVGVVALALAAGADLVSACHLANHAAGLVIREVGTATTTPERLLADLEGRGG